MRKPGKRPHFIIFKLGDLWYILDKTFGYYFNDRGICFLEANKPYGYSRDRALELSKQFNESVDSIWKRDEKES